MILYIVNSCTHAIEFSPNTSLHDWAHTNSVLFLTREFVIQKTLEKYGLSCDYLGNHITKEQAREADLQAYRFVHEWFLDDQGKDVSLFKGVSLARAARSVVCFRVLGSYFFQISLSFLHYINTHSIDKVIFEKPVACESNESFKQMLAILTVISEHSHIPFEMKATSLAGANDQRIIKRDQDIPFARNTSWLMGGADPEKKKRYLAYRMINIAKSFVTDSKTNILVAKHNPMQHYLEFAFKKGSDGIRYHFLDSQMKKYLFHKKHGKCFLLADSAGDMSDGDRESLNGIIGKFKDSFKRDGYQKRFCFGGIDFSHFFIQRIEEVIQQTFPLYIRQIEEFIALIDEQKLDLLFTAFDGAWYISLLIDLCKQRHIPTVELLDGYRVTGTYISSLCDYVLCWGESMKKYYFLDHLKRSDESVFAVGTPLANVHYLPASDQTLMPPTLNRNKFKVLVGGIIYAAADVGKRSFDPEQFLINILNVLAQFEGAFVTVRYREKRSYDYFKWIFDTYYKGPKEKIALEHGEDLSFQESIRPHDIYITNTSSSLIEAAVAGKYCISYQWGGQPLDPPYDGKSEMMVAFGPQDLKQKIEDILDGKKYTTEFNRKEVLEKYVGSLHNINDRIYDILKKIVLRKPTIPTFQDKLTLNSLISSP